MPDERTAEDWARAKESRKTTDRNIKRISGRLARKHAKTDNWDGKPANDNIAWPLAKALLAEGNGDLLKYAILYRKVYDTAKTEVALGIKGSPGQELSVAHKTRLDESTGRIVYGGEVVIKSRPEAIPATQRRATSSDCKQNSAPVPKPWKGDLDLINAIDARARLAHLHAVLGPLVEPFEMAVIDNATLAEVGNAAGIANRAGSMGAGRALVHTGLLAIRAAVGEVSRKDVAA